MTKHRSVWSSGDAEHAPRLKRRGRLAGGVVVSLLLAASLAACGGSSGATATQSSSSADNGQYGLKSASECKTLRDKNKSLVGSTLKVATSAGTPGLVEVDTAHPGKFKGLNVDLISALGECLGFEFTMESLDFAGIVPAVAAGRYDMAAASMYDTAARRQQVTYVDYIAVSDYAVVPKGNPKHINSLSDTCGLKTGVATGQLEQTFMQDQSAKCKAAGKPELDISVFSDLQGAFAALVAGRVDFIFNGGTSNQAFLQSHSDFEQVMKPVPGAVEGFEFPKNKTDLINAVFEAAKVMQDKGVEDKLIAKWNFQAFDKTVPAKIAD